MKRIYLIVFVCLSYLSLFADPSNPCASRGNIRVLSSEFNGDSFFKKYPVSHAMDGNPKTAWVFEKSISSVKDVIGLLFDFEKEIEIDGISLINGYAKSDSLYFQNNSVLTFEIILPNQKKYSYTCQKSLNFQDFSFPKQKISWMIIKVTNVRSGTKYNDLCISEISPLLNNEKLMYKTSDYILYNNGAEYDSDVILNSKNQQKFDTQKLDFGCGASMPFKINDSTLIYVDGCNDENYVVVMHLQDMSSKHVIIDKAFNKYFVADVLSETIFIMRERMSEMYYQYHTIKKTLIPTKYTPKKVGDKYWRWSENLEKFK